MTLQALEAYGREANGIYRSGSGVAETSYYPPLSNLLNAVGATLKPKVRAIINIANRGAGIPDGGLFTPDQFQRGEGEPQRGTLPSRGAIEVKGTGKEVRAIVASQQVKDYLGLYGSVLVTNLRAFALVVRGNDGGPRVLEEYQLADSEAAFWQAVQNPRALAERHAEPFGEYLRRVMLHKAELSSPQEVAWFLASYARDARFRLTHSRLDALEKVRAALSEALDLKFEGDKGEAFFRSTLVQTLFYGLFSAWVLHHQDGRTERFEWKSAAWELHLPLMQRLFSELANPSAQRGLTLSEVLDWATDTLNRVRTDEFFKKFEAERAVQYFYEPFLEAYDPDLRREFGVWYTPPEIVEYMVERVDRVLREELALPLGLADPGVVVLDPCTGTGSYLAEVVRRIHRTMREAGTLDALSGDDLKQAVTSRLFGFELMPAPYVVAHLQLGLLLSRLGSPLAANERAGVYLTNSLTDWEPHPGEGQQRLGFAELQDEHDAAVSIKRDERILVILGNPPYNAFAGVAAKEEQGFVDAYKAGLNTTWGIKKFNLDDLYVRFFRLAERRITKTGRGVVAYISNASYLSDPSFVTMRQRFLGEFDALWFDNLNGDSRETGKLTPQGLPDPSVFSTEWNKAGIRVGTAVGLMVRRAGRAEVPTVHYREFWGVAKRAELLGSLETGSATAYAPAQPVPANRYSFRPEEVGSEYREWAKLTELCAEPPMNGLMEKRGGALMDYDRGELERRMKLYYDRGTSWETLAALNTGLTEEAARFAPKQARAKVQAAEAFDAGRLLRYVVRPFDTRWAYYSGVRPLWNEPRPKLWAQMWPGNSFLISRPAGATSEEGAPFFFTSRLGDNDFLRGHAYYFPLQLKIQPPAVSLFNPSAPQEARIVANLSGRARAYLQELGAPDPDESAETAKLIWLHALAIGFSPAYLGEHADGIKGDWPRVPLPASLDTLRASAALGERVAALLDGEAPSLPPEVAGVAVISRVGGGQLAPSDLSVTAGWGHGGKGGVTMPGKGKTETRGSTLDPRLGATVLDVYLNGMAYWKDVPAKVWGYTIGGYQVLKKWLSYREAALLGRPLTSEEVREVRGIAQRLAALVLLEEELDANYRAVLAATWAWAPGEGVIQNAAPV